MNSWANSHGTGYSTSEYCTIRFTQLVVSPYSTVLYRHMKQIATGTFAVKYDYSLIDP